MLLPSALAHEDETCADAEIDVPEAREAASRVQVAWQWARPAPDRTVRVQVLGINDFHGRLSTGSLVANRPVGGAAVLAAYLRAEQASFTGTSFITHAGDHVGASPPESALLQDEPAITFLNMLGNRFCSHRILADARCNLIGTLGNHEFDEGVDELFRLLRGGNHPNGPFLDKRYRGANFPVISANALSAEKNKPILPPFVIRYAGGIPIAFIGAVLEATPSIVTAEGVEGLKFADEADSVNYYVRLLRRFGVESFVVLLHQGGRQTSYAGPTQDSVAAPSGDIADVVNRLDSAIDVVVSGHAHSFTNALMPNQSGHPILVTQAFSSGTAFSDVELTIDRKTRDVAEKSARIVTTYADEGAGLAPAVEVAKLVAAAQAKVAPLVGRVVAATDAAITRSANQAGESELGSLIADAQRTEFAGDIAFMNPGGIRADVPAGDITWGALFTVQPFSNDLVRLTLTGEQILRLLEQQWSPTATRILQVSGLRYSYAASATASSRVISAEINGNPLDPSARYAVVANAFLAGGGDGFSVFNEGQDRVVGPVDLDALVAYVEQLGTVSAVVDGRITIVP
jgi:5'-nucleotidase